MFPRVPGILLIVLSAGAAVLSLNGGPLVPVWGIAIVAVFLVLARRLQPSLALALSVAAFFGIELLLLRLTPLLGLGSGVPNAIAWTAVSLAVGVFSGVRPARRPLFGPSGAWLALSASASAIFLTGTLALAQVVPGALRLVWAMNGDAVNGMAFTRRMVADGGIDPSSTPQPTPLPFAMAAANIEGGRSGTAASALLEHDVARSAQVWVFVIALSCLLVGALAAREVRTLNLARAIPVVALASTAVLAWYVIGVQFEFGFMNSAYAIVLLLTAWLVYISGAGRPLIILTGLLVTAFGLLAVWSPLVICVIGLGIVTLVRGRQRLAAAGIRLAVPGLVAVLVLVYAVTVTLPGFLQQSDALGSDGGFPAIGPASIIVITALTTLTAALIARAGSIRDAVGALAVICGFAVGLGYLLLQRQGAEFGWGYYPAKFAWTTSILLVVVLMTFGIRLIREEGLSRWWNALITAGLAAVVASLLWGPVLPGAQVPLAGILKGDAFDNSQAAADIVFDLAGTQNGRDVLWRSSIGDFWPNTWLLQIDQPDQDPVKIYSSVVTLTPDQVCAVVAGLGDDVVIHTSDPAASADLAAACPDAQYTIVEGEY